MANVKYILSESQVLDLVERAVQYGVTKMGQTALAIEFGAVWLEGYIAASANLTEDDKKSLRALSQQVEDVVDYLSNSRDQLVINKAMDFPVIRQLLTYHLTNYPKLGLALAIVFPVGVLLYLVGIRHQANLKRDIAQCIKVADQVEAIFNGTDDRHQSN